MSVIANLVAMPNRIAIAASYLRTLKDDGAPREDVIKQLSPFALDDGGEVTAGASTIASAVIAEMEALGLASINPKGNLALERRIFAAFDEAKESADGLRPILRSMLTGEKPADDGKQSDVRDALAWLLVQDPFRPLAKAGQHGNLLRQQLDGADSLLTGIGNDSRYQNLLYWARYLGFANWISGDSVLPDPTAAISELLPVVFEGTERLRTGEFLARLSSACEIFEGSSARESIEERVRDGRRQDHHLSRSTSLALIRLDRQEAIALGEDADAEAWILDLGPVQRRAMYLTYLTPGRHA